MKCENLTDLVSGSSLRNGHGDTENSVGTELALVLSTVELNEEVVNLLLGGDGKLRVNKSGSNNLVDILNGLEDTYCIVRILFKQ